MIGKDLYRILILKTFSPLLALVFLVSCSENPTSLKKYDYTPTLDNIIPHPASVIKGSGFFFLTDSANIFIESKWSEAYNIGRYLVNKLNPATGFDIRVLSATGSYSNNHIYLKTSEGNQKLGREGYRLEITKNVLILTANEPAGLFRGVQTIRQLFPPRIESSQVQPGPWKIATGVIEDYPEYNWRGSMLDVARHFFSVEEVKRYIDLMAYYKMNRFHLHLTDDQGWRIMINSWPKLATYGGSTEVGGGPGGYYSHQEYSEIVSYAQKRFIVVIPEIDLPGHTLAALASYPELNCNGVAPPLYTGREVPFSSLCLEKDITWKFASDVINEIAALTPSRYIHIGGDEIPDTLKKSYNIFIEHMQQIVLSNGKHMIGWEEIGWANIDSSSKAQHWSHHAVKLAIRQGAKGIMSPASKAYLDMKYNMSTALGLSWAGYINVETAYSWYPSAHIDGIGREDIIGIEAPLWTETIATMEEIEFMAFPRLIGYSEIGWTRPEHRNWDNYKYRVGAHGHRLEQMDINFYRSTLIPWE